MKNENYSPQATGAGIWSDCSSPFIGAVSEEDHLSARAAQPVPPSVETRTAAAVECHRELLACGKCIFRARVWSHGWNSAQTPKSPIGRPGFKALPCSHPQLPANVQPRRQQTMIAQLAEFLPL